MPLASMITFGVTISAIQTVLKKYEAVGTLKSEFGEFCEILKGIQAVLENVDKQQATVPSASAAYFAATKQIHQAVKQGEEASDDACWMIRFFVRSPKGSWKIRSC